MRHYISQEPKLRLYGLKSAKLPEWFTDAFPAEYHGKQLFTSDATEMKHVHPFEGRANGPHVSAPERAFLELLSEVGVRQPVAEARELAESTYGFRASVIGELLRDCTSVKTVGLCMQFGRDLSLPWAKKLDPATFVRVQAGKRLIAFGGKAPDIKDVPRRRGELVSP